ncbi:hypothetical protein [Natronorubrum halophilum]|uniref:hypothetical protein n=1 Tax=Natronorubrum halophilum TaxID=1702106 RepID=UPI0010C174A8|nr:hypothetical protein [Natronorubrum halophilum]
MERRTFIATTGTGVGIGVAGCLNAQNNATEGNETTDIEDDTPETNESETNESDGDGGGSNAETDDTGEDDETTVPATFEVASMATNSPIGGGEVLEVSATIENVGDEAGTTDVDLVVGHDPAIEDSRMLTLDPGETSDLSLEFRAGEPAGDTEEFPVCVDTGAHEACRAVVVGDDGNGDPDENVTFESCERATASGTFEDGDIAYASTGFYDQAGFGNTIIEDGITIGEDVAPFTGTIVFELSDEQAVSERVDGVTISVPDYGEYGTVITGLTTDREDYMVAGITHANPHAEACLEEIESEWEDETNGGNGDPTPATFEVASMTTNSPVGGGEVLEVSATIENVGDESGTTDVDLVVGHDPAIEDSRMLTLEPGESADIVLEFQAGEPADDTEEFPVRVDTGAHEAAETVVVQ